MLNEQDEKNLRRKLEMFLNKLISTRYPEVNHIVVVLEKFSFSSIFEYEIYVNPSFDGIEKLNTDPGFKQKLFTYLRGGAEVGVKMFNKNPHLIYHLKKIDWFWD
jgi:hypothetical protein